MRHNRLRALRDSGELSIRIGLLSRRYAPAAPMGGWLTGEASEARQ